jgi:hypothetical protein
MLTNLLLTTPTDALELFEPVFSVLPNPQLVRHFLHLSEAWMLLLQFIYALRFCQ